MARPPKSPGRTARPKAAPKDATAASTQSVQPSTPDTVSNSPRATGRQARATRPLSATRSNNAEATDAQSYVADGVDDGDKTMVRAALHVPLAAEPRKNTLAMAVTRPIAGTAAPAPTQSATTETPHPEVAPTPAPVQAEVTATSEVPQIADELEGGVADEVDEWSAADQPTIYLPPRAFLRQRPVPQTKEVSAWPAHTALPTPPARPPALRDVPGRAAPPIPATFGLGQERLAAPDGRIAPSTPPPGVPRAALADPRMERFQELHQQRTSLDPDQREAAGGRPLAQAVRQWWRDLLPGVERALHHQHAASASGTHPLSAHADAPVARLGDAFGRLSTSARNVTQRTQAAVTPTLRRLHDQAEQRAQAIVERVEGSPARQQAPLLGPGRIAVFFQSGVTVSRAQALLATHQARPIRLIPRKHGFLVVVRPGTEAETAERLRYDQHVRDVAYLEFDEYGQPINPR